MSPLISGKILTAESGEKLPTHSAKTATSRRTGLNTLLDKCGSKMKVLLRSPRGSVITGLGVI